MTEEKLLQLIDKRLDKLEEEFYEFKDMISQELTQIYQLVEENFEELKSKLVKP
jgi:hypothetical protein